MSQFDATNEPEPSRRPNEDSDRRDGSFLGIQFECCGVYGRIYRDRAFRFYSGRCPRCLRRIEVPIGEGGSGQRFFRAR